MKKVIIILCAIIIVGAVLFTTSCASTPPTPTSTTAYQTYQNKSGNYPFENEPVDITKLSMTDLENQFQYFYKLGTGYYGGILNITFSTNALTRATMYQNEIIIRQNQQLINAISP